MPLRKADGPLTVQLPSSGDDRPSWLGVGVIAFVGFVVGVAWPHLAGVRLGPSVPDSATTVAASASGSASGSHASAVPVVPAALSATVATPVPALPPRRAADDVAASAAHVVVAHGAIFACKTASGDVLKGNDCGALAGLDAVVLPRLRRLAECPEAASTSGKLRLVVRADFGRDALAVDLGRDHGVPAAEPLLVCAKTAMASASLEGLSHDYARYSVSYAVTFGGGSSAPPSSGSGVAVDPTTPSAPADAPPAAADGSAQVEWEVAIVRDAPKTGKVVARLQRGTAVHVGVSKDGWFPVKYGDGFTSDGWVYRGAIGR